MNPRCTRRHSLGILGLLAVGCGRRDEVPAVITGDVPDGAAPDADDGSPHDVSDVTDATVAPIAAIDDALASFMAARSIPGAAVAVTLRGRLVYARGYGVSDLDTGAPVTPIDRFRIASLSKAFTAVAVLQLVEAGRLSLDATILPLLGIAPFTAPGASVDPRLASVTVRQLLQHTGGWDRDVTPDPMFQSRAIATALGVASPPSPADIARYTLGRPLDFAPGTRFAYSNFGYCLLGLLLERITGSPYEALVGDRVLAPSGIRRMILGRTLRTLRAEGEVRYHVPDGSVGTSVFDSAPGSVPWPYGAWCLESMAGHGAWVASAVDMARWCKALDAGAEGPLLHAPGLAELYARPPAPAWRSADGSLTPYYYACGWLVRPVTGGANYWHDGSLDGTASYLVRRADGLSWVALFNRRSRDSALPDNAIDGALNAAISAVRAWPAGDLFDALG